MPLQQQLSKQILLFKNKKLFYIITALTDNIIKRSSDTLNFKQSFLHINTTKIFQQDLTCSVLQCDIDEVQSKSSQDNILFEHVTNVDQQYNLIVKHFQQSLNTKETNNDYLQIRQLAKQANDYADNKQLYKNGHVYSEKQQLNVSTKIINDKSYQLTKQTSFELKDFISYKKNSIDYNGQKLYQDYQNFLYVLNTNYKFKLYYSDKFILDVNSNLIDGQLSKDIIFHACQQGDVYLKIYDKNDNFIKNVLLKKTTQFNLQLTDVQFYQNKMTFNSNKQYLQGRNIYHGNSICQTVYCNFKDKNNILYDDVNYKILSNHNLIFKNGIWLNNNSYIIVRVYFDKLVYIKNIKPIFSLSNIQCDILYRNSSDKTSILLTPYKNYNYNRGFYCNLLDIYIKYQGTISSQLQRIKIQLYDLQKQDVAKTNRIIFDNNNKIILNKQNIIDGKTIIENDKIVQVFGSSAIQKYNGYVLGYQYQNYFELNNIKTKNSNTDYIQTDNQQQFGYIRFALSKNALSGDIGQTNNNFRYIYLQYQIVPKRNTSFIDFKNFQILNTNKSFPKRLTLNYVFSSSNNVELNFQYSPKDSIIGRDNVTNKPISFTQRWNCVTTGYNHSYFYIAQIFVAQDSVTQIGNWNKIVHLTLKQNSNQIVNVSRVVQDNNDALKFINGNNSEGFQLLLDGTNYIMRRSSIQQPKIIIETNVYQQTQWQNVGSNNINTTSTIKRNLQIRIKDGQNKKIRLYSIVLKNHDNSKPNEFLRDETVFDVTGNNTNNKTNQQLTYIQNNFYNLMYCVNYFYSSQKNGFIFQSDKTYFDKSKYQHFDKSNLHIQWNKNQLFQYLILFDRFDNTKGNDLQKYSDYFLPFNKYYIQKHPTLQYCSFISQKENSAQLMFQFSFDKKQIILSIDPNIKNIIPINVKYDYYYSYSNDGIKWSQYKYYKPLNAFYAKYIKVKCNVFAKDTKYFDYAKNLKLNYVDSDIYYLTDKNYFESSYKLQFTQNTKYMIYIRKLYYDQTYDMTLKLFEIGNFSLLNCIQKLYVDDKLYTDHTLKISGVDNVCKLKFEIAEPPKQLHLILYKYINEQQEIVQQLYTRQFYMQYDNVYCYDCKMPIDSNKFAQLYGYKIRYFNNNYQVSQFSKIAKFKFNSIPNEPTDLNVDVKRN